MSAQTVSSAVARRQEDRTAIDFMWSKRSHLRTVLPKSVDIDAFLGTAAGALYASDVPGKSLTLMKCAIANVDSLFVALMECAALGHMPGTDEYYLTPRTDHGRLVVLGIEGYKGVVERMYRSGAVSNVIVREVCENDQFRYVEGEMDKPVHQFGGNGGTGKAFFASAGKRGEMVGGYAYAHLLTGAVSRVVLLSRDDIFAARDSGGYKATDSYSPWNRMDGGEGHPEFKGRSMWWKTFAKRLEPWVPTSAEWRRESLRASASAAEHAVSQHKVPELTAVAVDTSTGEVVDAEIVDEQAAPAAGAPGDERHRGLVGIAQQHFTRLGYKEADKQDRLRDATSLVLGTEVPAVTSFNDFTHDELSDLNRAAERCKDRAALAKFIKAGETSGE